MLVLRDRRYTDAEQVAFSACFGPFERTKVASPGEGTHFSTA